MSVSNHMVFMRGLLLLCVVMQEATSLPRQLLTNQDPIYDMPSALNNARELGPHNSEDKINIVLHIVGQDDPEEFIQDLHNPASPHYLRHLTPSLFADKFGAAASDIQLMVSTLQSYGMQDVTVAPSKLFIAATATPGQLKKAFKAAIVDYQDSGATFYAPDKQPTRPSELKGVAFVVHGLDNCTAARSFAVQAEVAPATPGSAVTSGMTPNDIISAYNVPRANYTGFGQTIAIATLAPYNVNDAAKYASYFQLGTPNISYVLLGGVSNSKFDSGGVETTLDVSMQLAIAPKARILLYETPNTWAGFISMLQRIADDNIASSVSCSWGGDEGSSVDASMNAVLKQMATQGQNFFVASGDSGCFGGSGTPVVGVPVNSPYATGVGGTRFTGSGAYSLAHQTTWAGSGGGVSKVFTVPSYQNGVSGLASKSRRNVPDVSLNAAPATGYVLFYTGKNKVQTMPVYGGTSAAAPLWAAFGGLVNQCRAAAGKGRIGFINPILYSLLKNATLYNSVMTDITTGRDNDYESSNACYAARTGYDAATGLGTFNAAPLIDWLCKQ